MQDTQLSEVQVIPVKPNSGLVGFASFVLNDCFYLGSIGIYTRPSGGYRLTYPTHGDFNVFYPINKRTAQVIEEIVIHRFEEVTKTYDRHNQTDSR